MINSLSHSLRLFEAGDYEQSFATALDQLKSFLLDVNTKLPTTERCWELEDLSRHFFDLMIEIFLHDDSRTKEEKEKRMEQIDEVDELRILSRYGLCDTNYYYNVLRYISEEHIQGLEKVIELKWNPISSTQYQLKIYRYCISRNDAKSALSFVGKHINILRLVHEELAQWLEKSANRSFYIKFLQIMFYNEANRIDTYHKLKETVVDKSAWKPMVYELVSKLSKDCFEYDRTLMRIYAEEDEVELLLNHLLSMGTNLSKLSNYAQYATYVGSGYGDELINGFRPLFDRYEERIHYHRNLCEALVALHQVDDCRNYVKQCFKQMMQKHPRNKIIKEYLSKFRQ